MTTNNKGQLALLKIQQRAMEKDITVSEPTTDVAYDLIFDDHGKIFRVQCKYGDGNSSNSDGAFVVALGKRSGNSKYRHTTYTRNEIDAVVVYVPKLDKVLWLSPEHFEGSVSLMFRFEPTRNGQTKGIRFAADYLW